MWRRYRPQAGFPADIPAAVPIHRSPLSCPVPSELIHFDFTLTCTVVWNGAPQWQAAARHAVTGHAALRLGERSVLEARLAETQLAAELAHGGHLGEDAGVRVWAEDVSVTAEARLVELAEQRAHHLRRQQIRDAEHEAERAERRYLKGSVFTDLASASLWWLRRHDHDVQKLSSIIQDLESAVTIVAGTEAPGWVDMISDAFDALAPDLNQNERYAIHKRLAEILASLDRNEEAAALLARAGGERRPD